MVEYSKVELGEWVDDEFSSFASDEVEIEVQRLLKRSRYEIAERLLRAVKKRTSGLSKTREKLIRSSFVQDGTISRSLFIFRVDGREL